MEYQAKVLKDRVHNQISLIKESLFSLTIYVCHRRGLLNWFQLLCNQITKLILSLTEICKNGNKQVVFKETILVHIQQQVTYLSLYINVFVKESEVNLILSEARRFCKTQILFSLEEIDRAVEGIFRQDYSKGNFIKWIDSALEMMNEIDYTNKKQDAKDMFHNTKALFEEVLSQAMTIAQVTLPDDYQKIRGSGQSVIEALDGLTSEFNKTTPNTAMLNLFIDSCTTKLCALEHKVNTAVLKLSIKVFSEYTLPLENLEKFSLNTNIKGSEEEFDHIVMDFDIHVDRIIQIGLFAIACSNYGNNCVKIRSCLACLEGMETELIPAFAANYKEIAGDTHQVLLLRDFWLNQTKILFEVICLIIDPFAFCEALYEENKIIVDELSEYVKGGSIIQQNHFTKLMRQSKVLEDFIAIILKEEQESNTEEIKKAYIDFQNVLQEVKSAYEILPDNKYGRRRIIKRCKILVTAIKTLSNCFAEENTKEQNTFVKETIVSTVKEQASNTNLKEEVLDPISDTNKKVLKDVTNNWCSTVGDATFKIPKSVSDVTSSKGVQQSQSSKFTYSRKKIISGSKNNNDRSYELQMTDILNELYNLTNNTSFDGN